MQFNFQIQQREAWTSWDKLPYHSRTCTGIDQAHEIARRLARFYHTEVRLTCHTPPRHFGWLIDA